MFFVGSYKLQLDERDRMRIPSKMRVKFTPEDNLYIMAGTGGSLFIVNDEGLQKMTAPLGGLLLSDEESQNNLRDMMSTVYPIEEDNQGRFVLPQLLKQSAGIDKKLSFIGMFDRIEVWSEEIYEEKQFGAKGATDRAVKNLHNSGYEI